MEVDGSHRSGAKRVFPFLIAAALSTGCGAEGPDPSAVEGEPGSPLPGLEPEQLQRFSAGHALFNRAFTPEEGLGPIFNQTRCSSCHDLPSSGGHGAEPVTKATRFDSATGCNLLEESGGDLLQASVVPALREAGVLPERTPAEATAITLVAPPPLYGLGLMAAVSEADIFSRSDPSDRDGDGISGRPGYDASGTLARFGRKSTHATLEAFIDGALRLEMGLTTPGHPEEELPNGRALPPGSDPTPDPEVDDADVALLVDYVRFLAVPQRRLPDSDDERARVAQGERLFEDVGCEDCHTPTLVTEPEGLEALAGRAFRIYSDLLLHDMGPDLADICAPGTEPGEWRTTPLAGLGRRTEYLHNNRAQRVADAIRLHGGEGAVSRDRFFALDADAQELVLAFLRTL